MNKQYIAHKNPDELLALTRGFLSDDFYKLSDEQQKRVLKLLSDSVDTLSNFKDQIRWSYAAPAFDHSHSRDLPRRSEAETGDGNPAPSFPESPDTTEKILKLCLNALNQWPSDHPSMETVNTWLQVLNQALDLGKGPGKSKGALLKTLRFALTGEVHGPALAEVMGILGRSEIKIRLSQF